MRRARAPDAHLWYRGQALIDFARKRIAQGRFGEAELDDVCLGPSALRDHLTIRFEAGPRAVFTLAGFPYVLGLCNGHLVSVPMTDLRGLPTEEAMSYLPDLAGPPIAK
ncbi:hypothetical protein ACBY01_15630 [Sphingomonas sp. ac-8]|uniref:hypothetical protein n=1 Tax=Sphingomonas sp. ac-8 TaxID=3242977 RepID=UPI003A80498D